MNTVYPPHAVKEMTTAELPQPKFGAYEPFVDENVMGAFLQLPPRRVLELARKGMIPSHPIGYRRKTWRFRISEVHESFSRRPGVPEAGNIGSAVPETQGRKATWVEGQ